MKLFYFVFLEGGGGNSVSLEAWGLHRQDYGVPFASHKVVDIAFPQEWLNQLEVPPNWLSEHLRKEG